MDSAIYNNKEFADALISKIHRLSKTVKKQVNLMEVCGTHTMVIARNGLRKLLPENINLISGPGCPVCVTSNSYLDRAIALSNLPKTRIFTFGDMF
ncbi:MAG TPA: hydrogenase formation protein HypD, partial [bacterium]|nr:hydrogenase formation protein HypD [bacterium]